MFDDIIKPAEEFYGGDDNPIEFECDFEIDEDDNVSYSFSDLEKALNIEDEQLEKAIDDAMKELFGDDTCGNCSDCDPVPEPDKEIIYDDQLLPTEPDHCDCGCDFETNKMEDKSLRR